MCVSLSCVSVVCLNLAFFFLLLHRLPPAPPLPRYEAFAGYFTPQSRKSRTIASLDTHAVAHTYEAHGRLHTRTRTERVHFYFWLAVTAPVCCLVFFFLGRALLFFSFFL